MSRMLRAAILLCAVVALAVAVTSTAPSAQGGTLRFSVTVPAAQASQALDGRLLVMIAKDRGRESRGSRSPTTSPAS